MIVFSDEGHWMVSGSNASGCSRLLSKSNQDDSTTSSLLSTVGAAAKGRIVRDDWRTRVEDRLSAQYAMQ